MATEQMQLRAALPHPSAHECSCLLCRETRDEAARREADTQVAAMGLPKDGES